MNILLWILQILLAVHTFVGAVWKFSNPAQTVSSLKAIPHGAWLAISAFDLLFSVALVVPAFKKRLAGIAALCIGAEMLLFCGVHLASGDRSYGPMIYWLVVAAICAFIAYGRLVRKPAINDRD